MCVKISYRRFKIMFYCSCKTTTNNSHIYTSSITSAAYNVIFSFLFFPTRMLHLVLYNWVQYKRHSNF